VGQPGGMWVSGCACSAESAPESPKSLPAQPKEDAPDATHVVLTSLPTRTEGSIRLVRQRAGSIAPTVRCYLFTEMPRFPSLREGRERHPSFTLLYGHPLGDLTASRDSRSQICVTTSASSRSVSAWPLRDGRGRTCVRLVLITKDARHKARGLGSSWSTMMLGLV
jgi:hypothetical protein